MTAAVLQLEILNKLDIMFGNITEIDILPTPEARGNGRENVGKFVVRNARPYIIR